MEDMRSTFFTKFIAELRRPQGPPSGAHTHHAWERKGNP